MFQWIKSILDKNGWHHGWEYWFIAIVGGIAVYFYSDPAEGAIETLFKYVVYAYFGLGVLYSGYRLWFEKRIHNILEEMGDNKVAKSILYGSILISISIVVLGSGL